MGVVYQARQLSLNRVVALKFIRDWTHAGSEDLEQLKIESETLAKLQHPHIVQVFEVGMHEVCPYFVMELMEGGSLSEALRKSPLTVRGAAELLVTLARAMHAVHLRGIIHRDLKPANVLLSADGTPKVADFGLAKHLDGAPHSGSTGKMKGTPNYMSPEQAGGVTRQIGPATDVYALGAILYELLTGQPPFAREGPWGTIIQVLTEDPEGPRRQRPTLPRDLETICLKCLRKEPAARYPTADALADDLQNFLNDRPITARHTSRWERVTKWSRRRPANALAAAAGVTILLLLVAGWWQRAQLRKENNSTQLVRARELLELADKYKPFAGARSPVIEDLMRHGESALKELRASGDRSSPVLGIEARLELAYANVDLRLNNSRAALGRVENAQKLYLELAARDKDDGSWTEGLARTYRMLGRLARLHGRLGDALQWYRKAKPLYELLYARETRNQKWKRGLAVTQHAEGIVLNSQGRAAEALALLQDTLVLVEAPAVSQPKDAEAQGDLASSLSALGDLLEGKGDVTAAKACYERALALLEKAASLDPKNDDWKRDLSLGLARMGEFQKNHPDLANVSLSLGKARSQFDRAVALAEDGTAAYPMDVWWRQQLAVYRLHQADLLLNPDHLEQHLDDSLRIDKELVVIARRLAKEDPDNVEWRANLAVKLLVVGTGHAGLAGVRNDPDSSLARALGCYEEALAIAAELSLQDPTDRRWLNTLTLIHNQVGQTLGVLHRPAEEREQYRHGWEAQLAWSDRQQSRDAATPAWRAERARILYQLSDVLFQQATQDTSSAAPILQAAGDHLALALGLYRHLHREAPKDPLWLVGMRKVQSARSQVLVRLGKAKEAKEASVEAESLVGRLRAFDAPAQGAPIAVAPLTSVGSVATRTLARLRQNQTARDALKQREQLYVNGPTPERATDVAEAYLRLARALELLDSEPVRGEKVAVLQRGCDYLLSLRQERPLIVRQEQVLLELQGMQGK